MTLNLQLYHHNQTTDLSKTTSSRFVRLLDIMREERPYLDGNLLQRDIAERLGICNRTLSRLISEHTDDNFSAFINRYRLREAMRLLTDDRYRHLSIEQIGQKAGFNTRSVFHRVFREETGGSPAQYRVAKNS